MDIHQFGKALGQRIAATRPGTRFLDEQAFEKEVLVKVAWELSRANPEIRVFTHPWKRKPKCKPNCEAAGRNFTDRVEGCPSCWTRSKKRNVADVFGMRNNFDIAAVDRAGRSMVVEVKWLRFVGNKAPNSEFQRFVGQCTLAAAANDVVIGVCGLWGRRARQLDAHEMRFQNALKRAGIRLIMLRGGS